jgi:hypothetical protein
VNFLQHIWRQMQVDSTPYYGDNLWVFLVLDLWLRGRSLN